MLLFAVVAAAAVALVVAFILALLQIRRSVERLERRFDESLRQFEMTAEDLRKTNAAVREILEDARRSTENVANLSDGLKGFRTSLDAASSVLRYAVVPFFGNVAGALAGLRAGVSHVVNRFAAKGGGHE